MASADDKTGRSRKMMTRRRFAVAAAGATLAPLGGAFATPATDVVFTAYALPTQWHPFKELHDWPLDHTCVSTSSGAEWGCFGRTYSQDPSVATAIASGPGDELWARAIAGPDGSAGIDYGVTGVCDQCSNRILLPAGLTVKNAPGDEIAMLLAGIYGLRLQAFAARVEDAAAAVNREHPGRISDAEVAAAVARLGGGLKDELALVHQNNARLIEPVLGRARYAAVAPDIERLYLAFHEQREALTHAYERGTIDKATLVATVRGAFIAALGDLRDVIGAENYAKIVPVPPQDASDYVFYRERA